MNYPNWPDFILERGIEKDGIVTWRACTNTGRPVTPGFAYVMHFAADFPEELVRQAGREGLDRVYAEAHPGGCPSGVRRTRIPAA